MLVEPSLLTVRRPHTGGAMNPPFMPSIALAIDAGDAEKVRALFREHPEQLHAFTPFAGGTWLHYAARDSTLEMVKLLLEIGFDVNIPAREGELALSRAAVGGHFDIAEHLLDQGSAMDVGSSSRNPLFSAIVGRSPEIARLLLERGIDSTVRYEGDWKKMDAVAFAMMRGEREIARIIALWNAAGDETAAERALAEGLKVARKNTQPARPWFKFW